jgi:hypothetical protein
VRSPPSSNPDTAGEGERSNGQHVRERYQSGKCAVCDGEITMPAYGAENPPVGGDQGLWLTVAGLIGFGVVVYLVGYLVGSLACIVF